jgi:energy-coupling factor transporter ATPase
MLETQNLSFAYHAGSPDQIVALRGVNFHVRPGELVAVIGHNGSGKSTLAKLLSAVLLPTGGTISVDEIQSTKPTVWEIRRRVGLVFQRPDDQLVANSVIDDIAFGPENLGLPRDEIEHRVAEVLSALGLAHLTHAQISELSGGEKQRVAIAGVLAMQPQYVILDEPTTMIAPVLARQLLALIHKLREQTGLAVVHITHFMHELVGFDRVVVMEGGQILMEGTPREVFARAEQLRAVGLSIPQVTELGRRLRARGVDLPEIVLTAQELREALGQNHRTIEPRSRGVTELRNHGTAEPVEDPRPKTQDPATEQKNKRTKEQIFDDEQRVSAIQATDHQQPATSNQPPATSHQQPATSNQPSSPVLEARDLRFTYMAGTPLAQEALRGVSCVVYEGETLAILGGTQAGKSTLIEFFNGLRRPEPGHVFYQGQDIAAKGFDSNSLRRAVGIVFQQPESQLFEDTIGKDVSFAPRNKKLSPAESRSLVEQALTDVGLDYETYRLRYIYALSGGQKRRVAIAGVLAAQPRVLILDEPVAGLDPRGREELSRLIADLTMRMGLTVILAGNAIDELAELAGRAIVLHDGQVAMEGPLRDLLSRADQLHNLGLELSEPAEIALALRTLFPDLPTNVLHLDELEEALIERLEDVPDGN